MKPTDFAGYLTEFLSVYLPCQKNASRDTIASCRDTFKLFLRYCQDFRGIPVEKLTMGMLSHKLVTDFLEWLESDRKCSISSRNQRLAAIYSFFRYAQYEEPKGLMNFQKVIAVPQKKAPKPAVPHLTPEMMQTLLVQPDRNTVKGRRDMTLMCTLYDSSCRVQELADLKVRDVITGSRYLSLPGKAVKRAVCR